MLLNCGVRKRFSRVPWTARRSTLSILKEISPEYSVNIQHQSFHWIFRTDAETETTILWPPDVRNWLIGKDPNAGKDWRREEKGMTEDEMVGWHHWLNGHEFEQAPGVGDGQGSLACYSPWGHKKLDTTEWLNWTEFNNQTTDWIWINVLFIYYYKYMFEILLSAIKTHFLNKWIEAQGSWTIPLAW